MSSLPLQEVKHLVEYWLNDIVIGLGLCPFASKPARDNTIAIQVVYPQSDDELLTLIDEEMQRLDTLGSEVIETSLVVFPELLQDFFDYNQFLQWANRSLKRNGWQGTFQLASFHPDYVFAGSEQNDPENLTNRAPFPMIHIIREASLEKALAFYPDIEQVPERNQALMESMASADVERLFYFLFDSKKPH